MLKVGQRVIHSRTGGIDTVTEMIPRAHFDSETKKMGPGYKLKYHEQVVPEHWLWPVADGPPPLTCGDRVFIKDKTLYGTIECAYMVNKGTPNLYKVILDPGCQSMQKHLVGVTVDVGENGLIPLPREVGRPFGIIWPNHSPDLFHQ